MEGGGGLLTQKQQLKVKSRYLRQTVPHVAFSLNSPILGLSGKGASESPRHQDLTGRSARHQWGQ